MQTILPIFILLRNVVLGYIKSGDVFPEGSVFIAPLLPTEWGFVSKLHALCEALILAQF